MKILYGINGTGNGHITKSLNIISNLNKLGYKNIDILISGNNHSLNIPYKYKFHGFSLKYNQYGSIDYLKTLKDFKPLQFIKDIKIDLSNYDKIITDFEPITSWTCKKQKVSIPNHIRLYRTQFLRQLRRSCQFDQSNPQEDPSA